MKKVEAFEIIDHGVDNEQYFQGCGTAFTEFEECHTGNGDSPHEALEDALESAAQNDWDVSGIDNDLSEESGIPEAEEGEEDYLCECWHYVSVRVK